MLIISDCHGNLPKIRRRDQRIAHVPGLVANGAIQNPECLPTALEQSFLLVPHSSLHHDGAHGGAFSLQRMPYAQENFMRRSRIICLSSRQFWRQCIFLRPISQKNLYLGYFTRLNVAVELLSLDCIISGCRMKQWSPKILLSSALYSRRRQKRC